MNPHQETLDVIHGIWNKLNTLHQTGALETGALVVLLLFVFVVIFLVVISCTSCCFSNMKRKSTRVEPV